ncbi:MAG: hypothetical protein AB1403_14580 [Candidatus Riflebacteria bacterium]
MGCFSEKIVNEFCRMCVHMVYDPRSSYPYTCNQGSTCFKTPSSSRCHSFEDRNSVAANNKMRELKAQEEQMRDSERRSRLEHDRRMREEAALKQRELEQYARIEQEKIRQAEQLQRKAQTDKEQFEIKKQLQEVALLTISDFLLANRSLEVLLGSSLFKTNAEFVKKEIFENPTLADLVAKIAEKEAFEKAKSIMQSITIENVVPKLIELQEAREERIVNAIITNKLIDLKFNLSLWSVIEPKIIDLNLKLDNFEKFLQQTFSNEKLNFESSLVSSEGLKRMSTNEALAFHCYHSQAVRLTFLTKITKDFFLEKVNQILTDLARSLKETSPVVGAKNATCFFDKILLQSEFGKEHKDYIEFQKKNSGWTPFLTLSFYSMIFMSVIISYFEIDIPLTINLFVVIATGILTKKDRSCVATIYPIVESARAFCYKAGYMKINRFFLLRF